MRASSTSSGMAPPLGQGAMFQIYLESLAPILASLKAIGWRLYEEPRESWYRAGNLENGMRQFLVQDPDGYLILFGQSLGTRARRA